MGAFPSKPKTGSSAGRRQFFRNEGGGEDTVPTKKQARQAKHRVAGGSGNFGASGIGGQPRCGKRMEDGRYCNRLANHSGRHGKTVPAGAVRFGTSRSN
jgi:hypothetical protein